MLLQYFTTKIQRIGYSMRVVGQCYKFHHTDIQHISRHVATPKLGHGYKSFLYTSPQLNSVIKYKLPTVKNNDSHKTSIILDQLNLHKEYHLPTFHTVTSEKVSPSFKTIVPIEMPSNQKNITEKIANPVWKMKIRKSMMKKHKLRKMRKRLIFFHRKLAAIKKAKKEKEMRAYEKQWDTLARQFDVEDFVRKEIEEAKKGDWSIDMISKWKNQQQKPL